MFNASFRMLARMFNKWSLSYIDPMKRKGNELDWRTLGECENGYARSAQLLGIRQWLEGEKGVQETGWLSIKTSPRSLMAR
jgi:hypothetical protein